MASSLRLVVREHWRALSRAEVLVVAHPNWWGKPPAIMSGWTDRVLVPGVVYRLDEREGLPTPLLRLRAVLSRDGQLVAGEGAPSVWRRSWRGCGS